jgi:Family of unknown function (DUF5906)/RepB DNA-primase from phage plasmid
MSGTATKLSAKFEPAAIHAHFSHLHSAAERANIEDGKLVLAVYGEDPETNERFASVQHFVIGDIEGMTSAAMTFDGVPHRNVYSPPAVMRPDLEQTRKGGERDVAAVFALVIDGDADKGRDAPTSPIPADYIVESSTGNFQEFLFLDRPLPPAEAKAFGRALKRATGAECVDDASHVWRVPGTLNWPNAAKIKRGRSHVPQPVRVHRPWTKWTNVAELRAALEPYWEKGRPERKDAVASLDAPKFDHGEVAWWIDRKVAGDWKDDPESPWSSQGEWILFGKAIKSSFPNEDGFDLWMRATHSGHDTAEERWNSHTDFKPEYVEGMRTLHWYLNRDISWMFRDMLGCPVAAHAPFVPYEIPAEILEGHKREREQCAASLLGPLPNHPELPMGQAEMLVKFWAHLPSGKMIYEGTREMWTSGSLDKHIGRVKDAMKTEGPGTLASTWLSQHRAVKSMGWAPGEPMIVEDKVLTNEGWLRSPGDITFNRYLAPDIEHVEGDVSKWLNHIRFIYPNEADHIVRWFAHRVQRPGEKVNHCLDFIGPQGIGKDTIIEPVIAAIGKHNFQGIAADVYYSSDFNDFLQSVILRLDEIHDLGGESRYGFYDKTKTIITAPPSTHRINIKYVPQYSAVNVCGVIMTSNHLDALYISPDDRRHFVCVSTATKENFSREYWDDIRTWFEKGGNEAVAHFLANLDLSEFNAKAPPPKTAGWHMVVAAGLAPESGDLADVIEALGKLPALTLPMIRARTPADSQLRASFEDAKLRRAIPKRLAEAGYIAVTNPDSRESGGRWRMPGGKTTIYARQELGENERLAAARSLSAHASLPPLPT